MGFVAPIGAAIIGGASAVGAAAAASAPLLTAASGFAGIIQTASAMRGAGAIPSAPSAPELPDPSAIAAQEKAGILRASQKRTKTILTSPLGETDSSTGRILKKTLGGA